MNEIEEALNTIDKLAKSKGLINSSQSKKNALALEKERKIKEIEAEYQKSLLDINSDIALLWQKQRYIINGCKHSFILCLGKNYAFDKNPYPYCVCLACGRSFRFGEESDITFNLNSIIDVREKVPEEDIITLRGDTNILVLQARLKLQELITNGEDLTLEQVKKIILEDLINNRPFIRERRKGDNNEN